MANNSANQSCGMIFEEDLSGVRDQNNFIAFPVDSAFYKSTLKALAW